MIKINNQYKIKLKVKVKGKIKEELLMKLENQYLLVEVSEDGAEITKIYNKEDGTDIIWEGNPEFWTLQVSMDLQGIVFLNVWKAQIAWYLFC